jgi:LCP family protein required for cell wall assembly
MATVKMRKQRLRRWMWVVAPVALFGLVGGAGFWYLQHLGLRPADQVAGMFRPPFGGLQHVNVLILGVDSDAEPRRSDTMMLVALAPSQRRIGVLSVPRDFRVRIPGHNTQRINAAYTLGGVPLAAETVQALTGAHCDYYIKVTSSGLARLVDALGGVELEVDKRMHYRDRSQRLFINLQPGLQRLNGEQAVGFVRFRHDPTGDLARIRRQQLFVRAVMREALEPRNLARLPGLLKLFSEAVETDLTLRDLDAIADLARDIDPGHIKARTLPGTPVELAGVSYLDPDYQQVPRIVGEVLYGARPAVAIVNATGIPGVEAGLVRRLGGAGYEVTEVRFATHSESTSEVMDRTDHPEEVGEIHDWLNCGNVIRANGQVIAEADITVLLGTDYIGK